jgi:ketosteroid isomerase-like protein
MSEAAQKNVELVRSAFEAYAREGPDAAVEMLDPEVEVYSPPALANAGTYHGVEGYLEWTHGWFDAWQQFEIVPQAIEPVGESCVIAICRQRGIGKASGIAVEQTMTYMWEIRSGKVTRFHLYLSADEAREAARGASSAS